MSQKNRWASEVTEDGKVRVPISKKTQRAMDALRRPGESDDDLLRRVIGTQGDTAMPSTGKPDQSLETFLAVKTGRAKPIGMDEKVKLSKDPSKNRFTVLKKSELLDETREVAEHAAAFPANERERETAEKLASILHPLDPIQQQRVLRKVSRFNFGDEPAALDELKADVEAMDLKVKAGKEAVEVSRDPRLQSLGESCYHKLRHSWLTRTVITPVDDPGPLPEELSRTLGDQAEIFVVQHDWAAAFKNAQDFAGGEYRLPFTECAFEFRLSGKRVICNILADDDGRPSRCILNIETSVGWMLVAVMAYEDGQWQGSKKVGKSVGAALMSVCGEQIKAICVALEAEVAVTDVIRAPYKLNAKRERAGKLPIYDYHVVSLTRRSRPAPLPRAEGDVTYSRKRLHFRRGHWRHFENGHKTWIRWMLVGDPELGFIDKHYKL